MKNVFLHIPKTAGQSMRHALKECSNLVDLEHTSVQTSPYYFEKKYEDVFSFCFVRNPFARLLSSFFHLVDVPDCYIDHENGFNRRRASLKNKFGTDFNYFILEERFKVLDFEHFYPMVHYVVGSDGSIPIDFIGRFENLSEDFKFLSDKLGLPTSELPRFNGTSTMEYKYYKDYRNWDVCCEEIIREFYKVDFRFFNYDLSLREAL